MQPEQYFWKRRLSTPFSLRIIIVKTPDAKIKQCPNESTHHSANCEHHARMLRLSLSEFESYDTHECIDAVSMYPCWW